MSVLYRIFIKGLLTLFPMMLTVYLLAWVVRTGESVFGDGLRALFPTLYFPGLGVALAITVIFLVGLLVNNYLAARTMAWIERTIERAPVIKAIYGPIRDVTRLFSEAGGRGMKHAVLVEFPGLGAASIGLVTREKFDDLRRVGAKVPEDSVAVFIPYSYAVGGFTLLVPRANVRELGLPPERALTLALTAWLKFEKPSAEKEASFKA